MKRHSPPYNTLQAIKKQKWHDIQQCSNETEFWDHYDPFALHEVCGDSSAPMKIVQDIYNAYPQAAFTKDTNECTPIHIAVEAGFEPAVEFLASACPKACAISCKRMSTPIQAAIHGFDTNIMIDCIVLSNPEAAFIPDDEGDTGFDNFFRMWNACIRIAVSNESIDYKVLNKFTGHGDWKVRDIYGKACSFLKAANLYRKVNTYNEHLLVHSALREESCHWAFCKLFMNLHPEQVLRRDFEGNLPIHIIAASKESSDKETLLCVDCFMSKSMLVGMEFINGDTKYCCEECFKFEPKNLISKSFNFNCPNKFHFVNQIKI